MINIGKMNQLTVVRKTDLGYMLTDGKEEILLHYREALKELEVNEKVEAYVYTDKENRKTGTLVKPNLLLDESGFVEVVEVLESVGVFVSNNTPKDLLISKDNLPYTLEQWPIKGDKIYCGLKLKKDVLYAKPLNRFDIIGLHSKTVYAEKEQVTAYVIRIALKGIGLITKDLVYVFVPNTQFRKQYRLGEEVLVTITKMLKEEAYGTLNAHKEILMDEDRNQILEYLNLHNGTMPLTSKSSSEEVERIFQMSRKAFKRAYGALYKEQFIEFDEHNTYLKKL